eukprot:scpid66142/ scgid27813/ Follistatin-related protein 4; Follistatin-like protein 4; m-D/Bsp120I 1-1
MVVRCVLLLIASVICILAIEDVAGICSATSERNGTSVMTTVLNAGINTTISCTNSSPDGVGVWYFGSKKINIADNCDCGSCYSSSVTGQLTICSPSVEYAGVYRFGTSRNITLYFPPAIQTNPSTDETNKGSSASLSCTVTGFPAPNVVWMQAGRLVNDSRRSTNNELTERATKSTLSIEDARYSDRSDGMFTCVGQNYGEANSSSGPLGEVESTGALVRVRDPLGALWPSLGILGVILVMTVVVRYSNAVAKKKEEERIKILYEKDLPNSASTGTDGAVTIGSSGGMYRRTSQQFGGDVPLLTRTDSASPPHGYSV